MLDNATLTAVHQTKFFRSLTIQKQDGKPIIAANDRY